LIGANQYNAVLRDSISHSWWQQETGKAIAGPLKGKLLKEVPAKQSSLSYWVNQHPASLILQADILYENAYAVFDAYEKSAFRSNAMQTDTATYAAKSLVVGVVKKNEAKAYDWNKLRYKKVVEDSIAGTPLLIIVSNDNTTFHVFKRSVHNKALAFKAADSSGLIRDKQTESLWNVNGSCIEGQLAGAQLQEIEAYQETRQSWENFHPDSFEYGF